MNQSDTRIKSSSGNPPLGGQDFLYYWRYFRWPFLIILATNVALYVLQQVMLYVIFVDIIYFIFLSWLIVKRLKGNQVQAATMGTISGLALGLMVSIFKLIYFWKVYLFFNIITETLITGLVGLLIGAASYLVWHGKSHIRQVIVPGSDLENSKKIEKKGGERSG
ncbi:MAG: hypothetical protein V1838_04000 [Patescibacteria group bacterium]